MDKKMVLFFVLEKIEMLDNVLLELNQSGIHGATIINTTGAAKTIISNEDDDTFSALRQFFNPARDENKTIFTVLPESKLPVAREAIERVVGDLSKPYTGILFAFEAPYVAGIIE